MSPVPESFIRHLAAMGYHPRSDKHSNSLAQSIADDLARYCPTIRSRASTGQIVYDLNFTLHVGTADWNVDLVLGPPALGEPATSGDGLIRRQRPAVVQIAVELKAVMTEHRKAVKNRKRDLEAHHEHVHNYNNLAIAAGVLIINASPTFQSPLRPSLTTHRNPARLVEHCIAELRSVAVRGGTTGYGLEAKCALVVHVDNVDPSKTRFQETQPAVALGDPLHYDGFLHAVCDAYTRRFS
jgi:hypothetical protein